MSVIETAARERQEGINPVLLGAILFIASEVMFFAGLFAAYWNIRADAPQWPPAPPPGLPADAFDLDLAYITVFTVILVSSSFTMQWAISSIKKGNRSGLVWGVLLTLVMGSVFLMGQAIDYTQILEFRFGDGVFGTTYFTLTGFHGLHVLGGVGFLAIILVRSLAGDFSDRHHLAVEACSYYWHFVDVVWITLFTQLYLLK